MMGGYLQRVVESGMTSLHDVRGSIHHAPVARDSEEQHAAAPFDRDEAVSELTRALPVPPDARPDPRDVPLAHPALDMHPPEPEIEERRSHETVAARSQDARGTGADAASLQDARGTSPDAASLQDAGIRSVRGESSRDGVSAAKSANRERPVPFEVTVQPLDRIAVDDGVNPQRAALPPGRTSAADGERLSTHPGVSAARVEQWTRLKDRLLIEHFPGTSNSKVTVEEAEHDMSPPTNMSPSSREIVIEQLEVVVSAPHPASPPPAPGPAALPARSGAWSVAARRYLGKL